MIHCYHYYFRSCFRVTNRHFECREDTTFHEQIIAYKGILLRGSVDNTYYIPTARKIKEHKCESYWFLRVQYRNLQTCLEMYQLKYEKIHSQAILCMHKLYTKKLNCRPCRNDGSHSTESFDLGRTSLSVTNKSVFLIFLDHYLVIESWYDYAG